MTVNQKLLALIKSIGFITLYLLLGAILSQLKPLFPSHYERYAQGILGTIGVLITVVIFLRHERKSWRDYGLVWDRQTMKKFGIGIGFGVVIALFLMSIQIFYSDLKVSFNENVNLVTFLPWSLAFIPLAFMEEIAFRSYPLIKLNQAFGLRATQFILAILFAVYHMLMMWSPQASLLGPGIWALSYALMAIAYGGIAVPTGLHFGLNFVQSILGGQKGIEAIWHLDYQENVSEASIATNENLGIALQITVLLVSIIATEWYIRRKKTQQENVYYLKTLKD